MLFTHTHKDAWGLSSIAAFLHLNNESRPLSLSLDFYFNDTRHTLANLDRKNSFCFLFFQ